MTAQPTPTSMPPSGSGAPATRQLLLSVWCPRPGEFAARAVLADGTLRDFDNPFELVRFLSAPPPPTGPAAATQGLR
jgi:hypothetical protein